MNNIYWFIGFSIWISTLLLIAFALWQLLRPYYIVWTAYKNPKEYVGRAHKSYRGMYKIRGKHWMVNNLITKNSWCIRS